MGDRVMRKLLNIFICVLVVTAFIPSSPLFADSKSSLYQDIRTFNEKSELVHSQFMDAYENLKASTAELEKAYSSGNETAISQALVEYEKSRRAFQEALAQALALLQEGNTLAARMRDFIGSPKADANYNFVISKSNELSAHLLSLNNSANISNLSGINQLKAEMALFESFMNITT